MSSGVADDPAAMAPDVFGVYVHIPFCAKRCDYCAFATWTDRDHLMTEYVDAVVLEIERASAALPAATTVFFGGGTPSLLPAADLARIVAAIPRVADAEVTVECNPDTLDVEKLDTYRSAGVNRLSLGVQSMVPHVLLALGRTHDPDNVRRSVADARAAGFDNINLDLIYGAVGESLDDWRTTLEGALALEPEHVSAYGLTVEAGTPLAADPPRHPDDDDEADKYLLADRLLPAAGLSWYEVSNFARPGRECRHNRVYWSQGDYRGFGCAAHSHQRGRRFWNLRTPERYIAAVRSRTSCTAGEEVLGERERRIEGLQLAIRERSGIAADALPAGERSLLLDADLVRIAGGRATLTTTGRLLANEVAVRLD